MSGMGTSFCPGRVMFGARGSWGVMLAVTQRKVDGLRGKNRDGWIKGEIPLSEIISFCSVKVHLKIMEVPTISFFAVL